MKINLKDKNCLIFGADTSFSRELCKNLVKLGINLGLIDLSSRNSLCLAKELEKIGIKAISSIANSSDIESFRKAVDKIKKYLGSIDFLICSYYLDSIEKLKSDVDKLDMDKWDDIFRDWVESYFLVTKAVLPEMLENRFGKIIFINTTSGYTGEGEGEGQLTERGSLYEAGCSSAITGMMTSLAREIIPSGISVNGIALGPKKDKDSILNTVLLFLSGLAEYACGQIVRIY